jgi:magnesium-protoporphyrin O-methyltransferase
MSACCGEPIPSCNALFDDRTAADDLAALRAKGPPWATRELLTQLASDLDLEGLSVLDIGAGVGAVHLGLLELGAATAVDVDGSAAYLAAARDEASRRELAERVTHVLGDATIVGDSLAAADLVALDRVICCYGDVHALVATATRLARRRVGLVYPRDRWWMRLGAAVVNPVAFRRYAGYRMRIHRRAEVDRLLGDAGFVRRGASTGWIWRVECWERVPGRSAAPSS